MSSFYIIMDILCILKYGQDKTRRRRKFMKDYYQINEISKLYGIGLDSLRYYERIGVLKPLRGKNGYRLYSLNDIYKLNIIKDLRQLGMSMKQIKEYLDGQCIENTIGLLENEKNLIRVQMEQLEKTRQSIERRMAQISEFSQVRAGEFVVKKLSERPCLQLNTDITRDEEMDLAIKKLHRKYENRIHDFGSQPMGGILSAGDMRAGIYSLFHSVFFVMDQKEQKADFVLQAGYYLTYCYHGDYKQSPDRIKEVLAHGKEMGVQTAEDILELYHIDNRYTMRPEEFLTEIQVRLME